MNIYKEVIRHEVFPAMGCTEPSSVAYAASVAAEGTNERPEKICIVVDQATYKNGLAVHIPNTAWEKGNLIAGVLGCLVARPDRKMEVLKEVTPAHLEEARRLIANQAVTLKIHPHCTHFFVNVFLETKNHHSECILSGGHTNVVFHELDGKVLLDYRNKPASSLEATYRERLRTHTLADLVTLADEIDEEDMDYLRSGIEMNLAISREGMKIKKVGYYLLELIEKGFLLDDVFSSTKILAACAVDARMDGMAMPVMSSGGSGNQGVVATLVPYNVGKHFGISEKTILKSIALSHLLNSYVKVFIGDLAPICGCAIAAGVGAACGIVYQNNGKDIPALGLAVNNLVSDLGGMLCDGAKSGCALKVVSSTDAAIRSAYLAMNHYGIQGMEGFVGLSAEDTIRNLGRITALGMENMDGTIVDIMLEKGCKENGMQGFCRDTEPGRTEEKGG
ncbi:MAG: L-serine ammonia-lyase, iron-sulfur-dependent, subunit alpha [bacterium]